MPTACAWCADPADAPDAVAPSHGICPRCLAARLAALEAPPAAEPTPEPVEPRMDRQAA